MENKCFRCEDTDRSMKEFDDALTIITLTFMPGTDIRVASAAAYNLHRMTGADVTGDFNGTRLSFVNKDLHQKLQGRKKDV